MIVIDTNVLVSGLITRDADAPTARILDAALKGDIRFVLSPALLAEYRDVSFRPAVMRFHGLSEEELDEVLAVLVQNAVWRESDDAAESAPDPGDDHLWALLALEPDAVLVTGDGELLKQPFEKGRVISPADL